MQVAGKPARILSFREAQVFRRNGWKAADLHVHSLCSSDVISAGIQHPKYLYQLARNLGMDYVTFTDHDTLQAYDLLSPDSEGVVRGVEMKIKDAEMVGHTIHVNVYDLEKEQFLELEEIAKGGDLPGFLGCLKRNDLPFVYNHPLWFEPNEQPNLQSIPLLFKLFPVVEYNMHRIRRKNEITRELARRFGNGLVASTDTHSGMVAQAYTISQGETFREFFQNIRSGNSCLVVKDLTKEDLVQETNALIGQIFSQDRLCMNQGYSTGVRHLDRLINALSSDRLKDFPRIYKAAFHAAQHVSNSGLPASLYLRLENSLLPEIERTLGSLPR